VAGLAEGAERANGGVPGLKQRVVTGEGKREIFGET